MARQDQEFDIDGFIRSHLHVVTPPGLDGVRLYAAHAGSGLWRLEGSGRRGAARAPYWAYSWAGGLALARYVQDHPQTVAGRRVLDLGAGSGVVGIVAAKAGACTLLAAEIDPNGRAAVALNAALNGVELGVIGDDLTAGPAPEVDLVLVGDLFYARALARRVTSFLDRCATAGVEVLVGDPGRTDLPRARLRLLARHAVPDMGEAEAPAGQMSGVFAFDAGDTG